MPGWISTQTTTGLTLGEHIFSDVPLAAGLNQLVFNVPANALTGPAYARFRFSTASGLSYDGLAPDGEVEDYKLEIETPPTPGLTVDKTLLAPANRQVLYVGESVTFQAVINNTGASTIASLPLTDTYDSTCLRYPLKGASPAENDASTPGQILWYDLTASFNQDLDPRQSLYRHHSLRCGGGQRQRLQHGHGQRRGGCLQPDHPG